MGEHEDAAKHVIVIVVPYILIRKSYNTLLLLHINDLKALLLQVPYGNILVKNAKRFAVSADCVVYSVIDAVVIRI